MLKILILTDDIPAARILIERLDMNIHAIDDSMVNDSLGLGLDPKEPGFDHKISETMAALVNNYRARRPLAMITSITNEAAIGLVPHDVSCLLRCGQHQKRLSHKPRYRTDAVLGSLDDISNLTKILDSL